MGDVYTAIFDLDLSGITGFFCRKPVQITQYGTHHENFGVSAQVGKGCSHFRGQASNKLQNILKKCQLNLYSNITYTSQNIYESQNSLELLKKTHHTSISNTYVSFCKARCLNYYWGSQRKIQTMIKPLSFVDQEM